MLLVLAYLVGCMSQSILADDNGTDETCAKHHVPATICPFCKPELIREHGFCGSHGVPEALCTQCRPALIAAFKAEGDWCTEHGVPESQCEECHPGIKEKWQDGTEDDAVARKPGRLWCKEHGVAERECGICHPELAAKLRPGESLKVRTVSPQSADKAGIRVAFPKESEAAPTVRALGEARYNQNLLARITPLASGVVQRVLVDVGQELKAGEVLVEIASSEVAAAKRDYLISMVDERLKALAHERERQLRAKEISPERDFEQAESEYDRARIARLTARQRLANLGFTEEEIVDVEQSQSSSSVLLVRAPFSGTLVERTAVVGEAVEPGIPLFTLADLSTMWIELAVPESEAAALHTGLSVRATFKALPDLDFDGRLVWVHSRVDERTRLIKARAQVGNAERRLRDGMFAEVHVFLGEATSTLRIPKDALQRINEQPYVFVKASDDLFDLRRVIIGKRNGDTVELLGGIGPKDAVVVQGAFTIKSEFLKSRLGAGCVDE